ncbi:MAG: VCBS repeat-containing protein [Verrucomicrobiota bacterium]
MDLNNDGHADILSGSYSRMEQSMAGLFQVLWGGAGGFKQAAVLKGTDGEPLIIPIKGRESQTENICTRPTAVDWNGDGKLDLVVGNFAGSFYLFTGEGGGKFNPKPQPVLAGSQPLKLQGHHSDPFMADWDGDGDLDLLSGSAEGSVHWAENVAGKGKPVQLKAFATLIPAGSGVRDGLVSENDLTGPASSTRVWAEDVNGDGKLDILVGDSVTLVSLAKGISKEEFAKRHAKWRAELQAATESLRNGDSKRYSEIYQRRTEFMVEDQTGYVWLYLRK